MIIHNKVEKLFLDKGLQRGGIFVLSNEDALAFVDECERHGIAILGIDGFFLTTDTIQPSQDNSIDFSRQVLDGDIFELARHFIKCKSQELYFEIVCSE